MEKTKQTRDISDQIREFRIKYYEQMDPDYWSERILWAFRKHEALKTPRRKARYIVDIYSIFIQLTEILIIHINTLPQNDENFLHTLAIQNNEIRDFAASIIKNDRQDYLRNFIENFSYKIRGSSKTDNNQKKIDRDANLLSECISEYLKNYDFLNSYKHGYRLSGTHGYKSLSINKPGSGFDPIKIFEGDSHLIYYKVTRKGKALDSIQEISTSFTAQRVFGLSLFLASLLQNMRISELYALGAIKGSLKYSHFDICDKDVWKRTFSRAQFKRTIFQYNPTTGP